MATANERQVGGVHYQSRYQHWDFVISVLQGRYLEGCITKYVSRWRKKNGLEDLEKARHYLSKLFETATAGRVAPMGFSSYALEEARAFSACNQLGPYESVVVVRLATWRDMCELDIAALALKELYEMAAEESIKTADTKAIPE